MPIPSNATETPKHGMHWEYAVPIATIHVLTCLVFVPWCFSWSGVIIAGLGTVIFGTLGINLGYHRLLSHRSLSVPLWLERTLATLAVCSLEDTPSRWVANHRLHHCHSDDEPDPHSPRDGVAWSHMGWLFRHVPHRKSINFLDKYARDILVDPYYRALEQHPMAVLWIYIAHAVAFGALGLLLGWWTSGDWKAGTQLAVSCIVWGVFLRTVLVWHITWSVNSLTHLFGYRTYSTGEDSRNNWLVAILAMGEGWHNNHHYDPASASTQHQWWEFDITYYFILVLKSLGVATDVIQPRHARQKR
ncbi:MAG: fatty acid desaturase [Pirellulales bacterium]|nr:fatty acid desaturase [Pirellulales bacterium]